MKLFPQVKLLTSFSTCSCKLYWLGSPISIYLAHPSCWFPAPFCLLGVPIMESFQRAIGDSNQSSSFIFPVKILLSSMPLNIYKYNILWDSIKIYFLKKLQYILVEHTMFLFLDIICDFRHQVKHMKNEKRYFSLHFCISQKDIHGQYLKWQL